MFLCVCVREINALLVCVYHMVIDVIDTDVMRKLVG